MRSIVVAAIALSLVGCSDDEVLATAFRALLDGTKERPAISPAPTGTGTAVCTASGTTFSCTVAYTGLTGAPTAAHIHLGAATTTGAVVVHLCGGGGAGPSPACPTTTAGTITSGSQPVESNSTVAAVLAAMRGATAYVNVHTAANGGGEIRGQTAPFSAP